MSVKSFCKTIIRRGYSLTTRKNSLYFKDAHLKDLNPISSIKIDKIPGVPFHESYKVNILNHQDFFEKHYGHHYKPNHITKFKLPENPTDIKGVDSAVFTQIRKKQMHKKIPTITSNKYLILKFFPYQHHISLARKSNVAYTFTNRGGYKLNDPTLEKALVGYKGKYQSFNYFQENLYPLDTAVNRAQFRRFVKNSLFNSLQRNVKSKDQVALVTGVFWFRFLIVPKTQEDKNKIHNDMDKAINLLMYDHSFRDNLQAIVKIHNKMGNIEGFLRSTSKYNTLGAKNVPGYYPKLPFLNDRNLII